MTDYAFNWNKPVKADTITNFCAYTEQNPEHIIRAMFGFVRRPKFRWKDADEIYIGPGCYHHHGSTRNRLVWWNSELTFKLGSGGSNAASDDLGASAWHYIFIDDSAVNTLASNELTATEFLNDTTAPTWSDTYHGYYTGNDRCVFAVLTDSSNNVRCFWHDGGDFVAHDTYIIEATLFKPSNTFTDIDLKTSVPAFSTKAFLTVVAMYSDEISSFYLRTNGSAATIGKDAGYVDGITTTICQIDTIIITDSSQIIEGAWQVATANNWATVFGNGWFLPRGM